MSDLQVVVVTWNDAHSGHPAWTPLAVAAVPTPRVIRSVGLWLDPDDEEHVTLAQSLDTAEEAVDGLLYIPKGMVTSIELL